ncbi:SGNH/GDSL hydrolase family protein [Gordonia sp. HY002]|uniref:SGNH/GDSL hydrolase family protein n=1 Tax=Gordonia zhenghanii TaxID=2911516 RepID=UPI001EEFE23B|nr:SGNH/GDSL hydrolase family protein [Gordonia zhenghanii]MCF8569267.1 SGNH/GDSL hydrolase family protein [Gordonia zhenghanii]MCF8605379.1 SGNH/GDSL hydrolase family protein [Gordonia zhenghanii]
MEFSRFVAIGDSQTEGMCDEAGPDTYRGWADRLAAQLAEINPELRYANLAIRGKNTRNTLDEQLAPALAMKPDLVAAPLGMNDVIGRADLDVVHADLEQIYGSLAATGATVIVSTFPDIAQINPLGRAFESRLFEVNDIMRGFARRHGFVLVDLFAAPVLRDRRSWSTDRLHASSLGHDRFAAGAAHALDLPGSDPHWGRPLGIAGEPNPVRRTVDDARWLVEFFTPWIVRKLRGRSLGDGRTPKRPELSPVLAADDVNARAQKS